MRADAERNRQRIMDAALEAFAKRGAHTPMEAIAKRAGVGIGTFYRHFPTREDLLNALLVPWAAEVEVTCAAVIAESNDPHELLLSWLTEYVACVRIYRSCTVGLVTAMGDPSSPMRPKCDALIAATGRVLDAAGPAVHADIDGLSLNRLAGGVAIVADLGDLDAKAIAVMLERIVDGILAPEGTLAPVS
jgi:AcrR family transcriptional regulator